MITLANLAGYDVERATAAGTTAAQQKRIEAMWLKIVEHFGDVEPRAITYDSVQRYITARRDAGAYGGTVAKEVQALRRGLHEAHRRGHAVLPPLDWPKVARGAGGTKRRGREHPTETLAAWLAELPQDARDEAELALLTGLRASELKRITWLWVERAPAALGVPGVLVVPAQAAKARTGRTVALVQRAWDILERRAEDTPDGLPLLHQGEHKTARRLACERIGYPRLISLRDLRHCWATLANRAVGIDAARDGLGHSTLATTQRYISGDVARVAEAARAIEDAVSRHSKAGTATKQRKKARAISSAG